MSASIEPKSFTVRLASDIYTTATEIARKRAMSLNALIQESLAAVIRAEEEQARYDAYTLLGQDPGAYDVEYAIPAQAAVMLHE